MAHMVSHKPSSKSMSNILNRAKFPDPNIDLVPIDFIPSSPVFITPTYEATFRVSKYMQAYGKQYPLKVHPASVKNASAAVEKNTHALFRLRSIQKSFSKRSTPLPISKIHTRPISHISDDLLQTHQQPSKKAIDNLKIRVEKIKYDIFLSKSDKIELMRDLATYECSMGKSVDIVTQLVNIHSTSNSVPNINEGLTQISQNHDNMRQVMKEGLKRMNDLELDYNTKLMQVSCSFERETDEVRKYSKARTFKHLFSCVRRLSGIYSVIKISGDWSLENFHLDVQLASGHAFSTRISLNLMESSLSSKDVVKKIQEKLLPKLFLTLTSEQLILNWDQSYNQDFLSIIIELKGSPVYVNMLVIRPEDEYMHLSISHPVSSLRIPKKYITESYSIFKVPTHKLCRVFSTHLRYNIYEHSLEWLEDSSLIFQGRELYSPLMDTEYIINRCGINLFQPISIQNILVKGIEFKVEILSFKEMCKVKIISSDRVYEFSSEDDDFQILTDLQFPDIRKSPQTFMRSIELSRWIFKVCINSAFK